MQYETPLSLSQAGASDEIGAADEFDELIGPAGSPFCVEELRAEVREYFQRGLRVDRGDTVFDVGANVGVFSLEAARRAMELTIHAFEPVPPIYEALAANGANSRLLRNCEVRLHNVALAERSGQTEVSFFKRMPTDSTIDMEGKRRDFELFFEARGKEVERRFKRVLGRPIAGFFGRLVEDLPKGKVGRFMSDLVTGKEEFECVVSTLSEIIDRHQVAKIDLLKIDVEGAELKVLQGLRPDHFGSVQQIALECHDHDARVRDVRGLLQANGFGDISITAPAAAEETGLPSKLIIARRR